MRTLGQCLAGAGGAHTPVRNAQRPPSGVDLIDQRQLVEDDVTGQEITLTSENTTVFSGHVLASKYEKGVREVGDKNR